MAIRRKKIEQLIRDLLKRHGVTGAPVLVDKIARAEGATIVSKSLESEFSGFLYRDKDSVIIGVNKSQKLERQRFTIGHELGHFLLHEYDQLHTDRSGFQLRLRSPKSSEGTDATEIEANLFAAELLMPTAFLERELAVGTRIDAVDDEQIAKLAKKYGVSTQALLIKLSRMGYITD